MKVDLAPDFPITDEACKAATGRTLTEWYAALDAKPELQGKRRDAISLYLVGEIGHRRDVWWPTTIWVERERLQNTLQKDGRIEGYNICSTKNIASPIGKVFSAWSGETFGEWFGDGGKIGADGKISDDNGNTGQITKSTPDKGIKFTWQTAGSPDGTLVEVMFKETAGKTLVTLMHNRIQTRAEADGLRRAWSEAFARLKTLVEQG